MEILKNERIISLLELVHQTLLPFYSYYADKDSMMDSEAFYQFCTDFKIFPEILPEEKVLGFFNILSSLN